MTTPGEIFRLAPVSKPTSSWIPIIHGGGLAYIHATGIRTLGTRALATRASRSPEDLLRALRRAQALDPSGTERSQGTLASLERRVATRAQALGDWDRAAQAYGRALALDGQQTTLIDLWLTYIRQKPWIAVFGFGALFTLIAALLTATPARRSSVYNT